MPRALGGPAVSYERSTPVDEDPPPPSGFLSLMHETTEQVWYVPKGARRTVAPGDSVFRARSIQEYLAHKKQTPP